MSEFRTAVRIASSQVSSATPDAPPARSPARFFAATGVGVRCIRPAREALPTAAGCCFRALVFGAGL
eukprot:15465738-Alexandrium_andersonii.AAC.1